MDKANTIPLYEENLGFLLGFNRTLVITL